MESILVELWPYLLLFYLADGIKYLGTREIGLSSFSGTKKRFRFITPGSLFLNVLPGGYLIRIDQTPIVLTDSSLYLLTDKKVNLATMTPDDFSAINYDKIHTISADGKDIYLNEEKYLTMASTTKSSFLTDTMHSVLEVAEAKRRKFIQEFRRKRIDIKMAEDDWSRSSDLLPVVSSLCQILFILLFVLLPIQLYTDMIDFLALEQLMLIILINFIVVLGMTGYALHQVYKMTSGKLATELFLMAISPLSVPQALLHIVPNFLHQYDWLVAVALLGSEQDFHSHTRQRFHYIDRMKKNIADSDWIDFWVQEEKLILALVEQAGTSIQSIYQPPPQQDKSSVSYCLICHSEYMSGHDRCHDCQAELQQFVV